jgi:hypothetical protein
MNVAMGLGLIALSFPMASSQQCGWYYLFPYEGIILILIDFVYPSLIFLILIGALIVQKWEIHF